MLTLACTERGAACSKRGHFDRGWLPYKYFVVQLQKSDHAVTYDSIRGYTQIERFLLLHAVRSPKVQPTTKGLDIR